MNYNKKIALHTLGCKLNFSETSALGRILTDEGYVKVDFSDRADYYIINTCSVTENADKETRQVVKQALRINPEARVVVVGCYAQLKPEEIAQIPGVNLVLGTNEKFNLAKHLEKLEDAEEVLTEGGEINDVNFFTEAWSQGERTRSFLKVQDGCDYFCSFCTIPYARGKSRSTTVAKSVAAAEKIAASGVKEIVLTGVNIGDFGKTPDGNERTEENFLQLITALDEVENIERFRISSIEPNLLNNDIIALVASSARVMPHFHIPLQSGSDKILKLMRRKYLTKLYRERVAEIKRHMPHACIGVDVIVGFPGETEEQFQETVAFIESLDVSYLHVFTYSERANTRALNIKPVVPVAERKAHNKILRTLSDQKRKAFYESQLGSERPVLFEAENDNGMMYGFTDNYVKVAVPYHEKLINTIQPVYLGQYSSFGYVKGEVAVAV